MTRLLQLDVGELLLHVRRERLSSPIVGRGLRGGNAVRRSRRRPKLGRVELRGSSVFGTCGGRSRRRGNVRTGRRAACATRRACRARRHDHATCCTTCRGARGPEGPETLKKPERRAPSALCELRERPPLERSSQTTQVRSQELLLRSSGAGILRYSRISEIWKGY